MRTVELTYYKYDELEPLAQAVARERFADINVDYDWWTYTFEDAARIGVKILGFDLGRSNDINLVLNEDLPTVCKLIHEHHGESCDTYILATAFLHRYNMIPYDETGEPRYEDVDEVEYGVMGVLLGDFIEQLKREYLKMLNEEYTYQTSPEQVEETIRCNDYEFTKDGKFV